MQLVTFDNDLFYVKPAERQPKITIILRNWTEHAECIGLIEYCNPSIATHTPYFFALTMPLDVYQLLVEMIPAHKIAQ